MIRQNNTANSECTSFSNKRIINNNYQETLNNHNTDTIHDETILTMARYYKL